MKKRISHKTGYILSIIVAVIFAAVSFYVILPPVGFNPEFIFYLVVCFAILFAGLAMTDYYNRRPVKVIYALPSALGIIVLVLVNIISFTIFHVDDKRSRIDLTNISKSELSDILPSVDTKGAFSWADSNTAQTLAARKTGELADYVSLFTTSNSTTTMISDGSITKYIPLEYAGFFQWTKKDCIPGYIKVDPVNQTAEYIQSEISYSDSAYFHKNLDRKLRFSYPTVLFGEKTFQVAPDGNCYWVVEKLEYVGLWNSKKPAGIITLNCKTGETAEYSIDNAPDFAICVHGNTATEMYNSYGNLINGVFNFSGEGETNTTDDFGYVCINGELYYYTGVTSVVTDGSDESNIGVLLYNAHTAKAMYCQIAGAEEYSAMSAAEGVVQNFGYRAAFPSLTNVGGELTYTMVLKDSNGIVKQYAMVNYSNYSIAVTGDTLSKCSANYIKALKNNGISADEIEAIEATITVKAVNFIVNDGNTTCYIESEAGDIYKADFAESQLFIHEGDEITILVSGDENIKTFALLNNY